MQLSTFVLDEGQPLKLTQQSSLAGLRLLLQADNSSFVTAFQAGLICTTAAKPSGPECCSKTSRGHQADSTAFDTRPRRRVSVAGAQSDLIKQLAAVFEGSTASRRTSVSDALSRGSSIDIDAAVMVSVPSQKLAKASSVKALLQTWESLSTQQSSQLTRSSSSASSTSSSSGDSTSSTPEPQRPCRRPLPSTTAAATCTGSLQPR